MFDFPEIGPLAPEDVRLAIAKPASRTAIAALDESFFRVRFDRLTPSEKRYLRAMAELGPGPHRSGAIAEVLQRDGAPRSSPSVLRSSSSCGQWMP